MKGLFGPYPLEHEYKTVGLIDTAVAPPGCSWACRIQDVIRAHARDGWLFVRSDTFPAAPDELGVERIEVVFVFCRYRVAD